jgi:glutamate N-acetyltransferase/amino-acid N-acetyltransferase
MPDVTSCSAPKISSSFSSISVPRGFRFSAARAGLKPSGKPDLACALAEQGATAVAMFTSNRLAAAPVLVGREHLARSGGKVRFLVANSGNANCATGEPGLHACREICAAAAKRYGCTEAEVFPSSTGIIGVPLPAEKVLAALPEIHKSLGNTVEHLHQFSSAILTTDTREKVAGATLACAGETIHIIGVAKGSGMIAPRMVPHATMLAYIFTDARVEPDALRAALKQAVEPTFNRISVDGDTSTNDTVLVLASGVSGATPNTEPGSEFAEALRGICASLARQIVEDGEGVEHVIELSVEGAASEADAEQVARSIANSPLVKTAFAGCDPNWGRILAATGYSGVAIEPARVSIEIGGLPVCRNGLVAPDFHRDAVHKAMLERTVKVRVELGLGKAACTFLSCDLTKEYVRINAEYFT